MAIIGNHGNSFSSFTDFESIDGTTDNIIWDDGVDTGNLEYNETT